MKEMQIFENQEFGAGIDALYNLFPYLGAQQ